MSDDARTATADMLMLLHAMTRARLADLAARIAAGHLTAAESLALTVLRGGPEAESGLGPLIDAAQEEYGKGQYRVPVRVVADWNRCFFVWTIPVGMENHDAARNLTILKDAVAHLIGGEPYVIGLAAGSKLDVYECSAAEAGAEVNSSSPNVTT